MYDEEDEKQTKSVKQQQQEQKPQQQQQAATTRSGWGLGSYLLAPFYGAGRLVRAGVNFLGFSSADPLSNAPTEQDDKRTKRFKRATEIRENLNKLLVRELPDHVKSVPKRVFVGTWNVAKATPPSKEEMMLWLNGNSTETPKAGDLPRIAAISLQEAAMGGAALMLETTEAVAEWSEAFQGALQQLSKDAGQPTRYRRLVGIQLVGLILLIYLPHDEFANIRHLRKSVTRTGPLSTVGNKGAVGCRFTFHGKRLLFICGHFAPHEHNVTQRDHHYHSAMDRLEFNNFPVGIDDACDFVLRACPDTSLQKSSELRSGGNDDDKTTGAGFADRLFHRREFRKLNNPTERSRALLHSHDYCFFFGDLNYRLVRVANTGLIKSLMSSGKLTQLQQYDELTLGVRKGFIFEGFSEPPLQFLPTYKMVAGHDAYDTSKRKPAWTDRVLVHALDGEVDTLSKLDTSRNPNYDGKGDNLDEVVFMDVDDSRSSFTPTAGGGGGGVEGVGGSDFGAGNGNGSSSSSRGIGGRRRSGSFGGSGSNLGTPRQSQTDLSNFLDRCQHQPGDGEGGGGGGEEGKNGSFELNNNSFASSGGDQESNSTPSNMGGSGCGSNSVASAAASSTPKNNSGASSSSSGNISPSAAAGGLPPSSASFEDFMKDLELNTNGVNQSVENSLQAVWYCSVPSLKMSDHRPVSSAYDISCAFLTQRDREELEFDAKQELGLDFKDELKYAFL